MNEIRLFVSGYKRHFLIFAQQAAEALFRALDDTTYKNAEEVLAALNLK